MPHILAIDQGTSATKCVLVNAQGQIVAKATSALGERYAPAGGVEQDAEAIWLSVEQAVAACLAQAPQAQVQAIGLSNQRESALIWQRQNALPLSPVLSWQDRRTVQDADQLTEQGHADLILARSGLPLDPMFSALKIRWLLNTMDADRHTARSGDWVAGTIDAWLLARLGGEPGIEVGNASRTQLLNVQSGQWDDDLLAVFDIPPALLPRVHASAGSRAQGDALHPRLRGVPVCAVMADSHAALFAHGVREPGPVKATMGTGSSIMALAHQDAKPLAGMCFTIAWDQGNGHRLAYEGNIRAAGATLKWLAELFDVDLAHTDFSPEGATAAGLCLVPGFNGLGSPYWDAHAVGLLSGLTLATRRQDLMAAGLDAIAHQVADVINTLDAGGSPVDKLLLDGGPSSNAHLRNTIGSYIQRPVVHCTDPELSALGVAHMAGQFVGLWSDQDVLALPRQQHQTAPPEHCQHQDARAAWALAVARARLTHTTPATLKKPSS